MSPTARSLGLLRREGYLAEVVEHWVPYGNVRRDLFGFGDILAVHRSGRVLIVQATTRPNVSARLKKARSRTELACWLSAGCAFEVHGWFKNSNGRWECKRVDVKVTDGILEAAARPTIRLKRRGKAKEKYAALWTAEAT